MEIQIQDSAYYVYVRSFTFMKKVIVKKCLFKLPPVLLQKSVEVSYTCSRTAANVLTPETYLQVYAYVWNGTMSRPCVSSRTPLLFRSLVDYIHSLLSLHTLKITDSSILLRVLASYFFYYMIYIGHL